MTNKIDQYLIDHDVSYKIQFVRASICINAVELRINWKVELNHLYFDCWQTLNCLPQYNPAGNVDHQIDLISLGTEYGLQVLRFGTQGIHAVKRLEQPSSTYVLKQLLTDSRVLNYITFKAWASDKKLNFNNHNIKTNYWVFMINAIKLQKIFNTEQQAELNKLLT